MLSELKPIQRHVALTLSLHMDNEGGSCFPSISTLAAETGLAESSVRHAIYALDDAGYLLRKPGEGRGHSTRYQAKLPSEKVSPSGHLSLAKGADPAAIKVSPSGHLALQESRGAAPANAAAPRKSNCCSAIVAVDTDGEFCTRCLKLLVQPHLAVASGAAS